MKLRTLVFILSSLGYSTATNAVVCTDPSGNALHIQEMAKDAAIWVEEKGLMLAEMAQSKTLSFYEILRNEYNASAEISSVTTAISSTNNAASEERYSASPSACGTFRRVKGLLDSFSNSCDSPVTKALFDNNQSQITDCSNGGTGLNCQRVAKRRSEITQNIADAVEKRDGDKLLLLLDGSKLLGLSQAPMQPEDQAEHELAMSLLMGVEDAPDMPRLANGKMYNPSDKQGSKAMSAWARRHVLRSIPNAALARIEELNAPKSDGSASTMAMLKEQVNYYNSPEFIKLLTNTNDKSALPSNWETLTPEQKHEWNANAPTSKKITSSEQVIRMIGEMSALSLRLEFMGLESSLSTNAMTALLLKEAGAVR